MKTSYIFVVQKHAASHLHYDFRLEIDDVLKSWAIPKGPSTDTNIKRLAMETTDHDMSYANFEGIIPEGHYGAGAVIVWDNGVYENNSKEYTMKASYEKGEILVSLFGHKLKGGYALVKTHYSKNSWLFLKLKDGKERENYNITEENPDSVISNKKIEDIGK